MSQESDHLRYVIVLCDDVNRMKKFYREVFTLPVESEAEVNLVFRAGSVLLALRQRSRNYDGRSGGPGSPGIQLAFLVSTPEVDEQHRKLVEREITVLDPPKDQPWGHRTLYFSDPEGNILEFYSELN
jgi:catechol-2,3-dioxygenase